METTNAFWCGACKAGQIHLVARVAQTGYVSGQQIVIQTTVFNQSRVAIKHMSFALHQIIVYSTQLPDHITKREVRVVQDRLVRVAQQKGQQAQQHFDATLPIPPLPPTNTALCQVIQITYEVMVEARVDPPHRCPSVALPVTLGTVPLRRGALDSPQTPTIVLRTTPATATAADGGQQERFEVMENLRKEEKGYI